jgi:hypothetical protein
MPVTRSSAGMERAATFINTDADMRAPFNFAEWGARAEMTDATLLTLDEQGFTSELSLAVLTTELIDRYFSGAGVDLGQRLLLGAAVTALKRPTNPEINPNVENLELGN